MNVAGRTKGLARIAHWTKRPNDAIRYNNPTRASEADLSDYNGIATWNFREGSLAYRIEQFARLGYDAVSLSAADACAMCRGVTPDVNDAIARHGLVVAIHGSFMSGKSSVPADALLADFESYVAWNAETGALCTVNYDAARIYSENGERDYDAESMRVALKRMLSMSNGAGFSVGIEDWPRNREHLEAVADLQSFAHFGVLIDLGHLNNRIRSGMDPDSPFPVDAAQRYLDGFTLPVNELHVHNNDGRRDCHAPPTDGTADMGALAKMLRRKGVRCISTVEIVPAWCGLDEQQGWEAAREALAYWREVF